VSAIPEEEAAAYERGRSDGEIRERLAAHDRHFGAINGQLARIAASLEQTAMLVARMGDKQQAVFDTATATQEAVRRASERRWSVWQRIFTVLSVLATILGAYVAWRAIR